MPGQQDIELFYVIGQIIFVRFAGGQVGPDVLDQNLELSGGVAAKRRRFVSINDWAVKPSSPDRVKSMPAGPRLVIRCAES
jgi:hypothetical protein